MNNEKNFIPNTNPDWNRELPEDDLNSLVDKAGNNYDNGYNFDEKDDQEEVELEKELEQKREQKLNKDLTNSAILADELTKKAS